MHHICRLIMKGRRERFVVPFVYTEIEIDEKQEPNSGEKQEGRGPG